MEQPEFGDLDLTPRAITEEPGWRRARVALGSASFAVTVLGVLLGAVVLAAALWGLLQLAMFLVRGGGL